MPRNSVGSYSAPSGQFTPGTTIDSNVMNGKFTDIYDEITDSLSRSGKGGMTAQLRVVDGTANLPGFAFKDETTLGLHRAGAGDVRMVKDGTYLMKWSTTEVRVYPAAFFEDAVEIEAGGLTVTAGGLTVTAGGLTVAADGLSAIADLPTVDGVVGGHTLEIENGSTFSGDADKSYPLTTLAKATPNSVVRLNARLQNASAVTDWHEQRIGISYDVDTTVGAGGSIMLGIGGAVVTGPVDALADEPANALTLANGNLKLSGTAPNKAEALANTLTPANMVKAWGVFTSAGNGTGSVTIADGFNITNATVTAGNLVVTLGEDMAGGNYLALPQVIGSALYSAAAITRASGSTTFEVKFFNAGAFGDHDLDGNVTTIQIVWLGRQA